MLKPFLLQIKLWTPLIWLICISHSVLSEIPDCKMGHYNPEDLKMKTFAADTGAEAQQPRR